jgi:hypothetical protein
VEDGKQTTEEKDTDGYTSWAAVAGYFDGDGCVDIYPLVYVLHWVLSFSDNWTEQLEQVRRFLIARGISVGKPRRNGKAAWMFEVAEISSMKLMATKMLRSGGIYKKRRELQLLLDYYDDKVTGNQVIEGFNSEVRLGIRTGKLRDPNMPFGHRDGYARGRYASRYEQRTLTSNQTKELIEEYLASSITGKALALKFEISEATVSRMLKLAGVDTKTRRMTKVIPDLHSGNSTL